LSGVSPVGRKAAHTDRVPEREEKHFIKTRALPESLERGESETVHPNGIDLPGRQNPRRE